MAGDVFPVTDTMVGVNAQQITAGTVANTSIVGAKQYYGLKIVSVGLGAPIVVDNPGGITGTQIDAIVASAALAFFSPVPVPGIKVLSGGITISGGATMPGMVVYWL